MTRVYGEFFSRLGTDGYSKTFEPNRWEHRDVVEPLIGIDAVLSIQALVMQVLSRQKRSVFHGDRRHAFVALNNSMTDVDETYDGSLEEYLSCRVAKVAYDQWRMKIRFRQNEITQESNKTSYVDDFSFDWLRNGNLQAWYGNYQVKSGGSTGTTEHWVNIVPIDQQAIDALHSRIEQHMSDVTFASLARENTGYVPRFET